MQEQNKDMTVWDLISQLANKKGVTELAINGPKSVFIEINGDFTRLNVTLKKEKIYSFIKEVAQYNKKEINDKRPIFDGLLPDGSRVNIVSEPISNGAPAITIRKYNTQIMTFDQNKNIFELDQKWISFFKAIIESKLNIVICGGTGVGKTTFLNLLLQEVSTQERIVTIEDTIELKFNIPNTVRLETNGEDGLVSTQKLVKNTLRMRPDRIILGEARGPEIFDVLQAMNTGHDGSMVSVHANSCIEALSRIETLYMLNGNNIPITIARKQISMALDFIVHVNRTREGERFVSEILEVNGMEGDSVLTQSLAKADENNKLQLEGLASSFMNKLIKEGGLNPNFFISEDKNLKIA